MVLSVKYWPSRTPSGGLETTLILKFNCSKSITFLKMKKFFNKVHDYEFAGEVKIEESEEEEEILR